MIPRLLLVLRRRAALLVAVPAIGAVAAFALAPRAAADPAPSFASSALVAVDQAAATETEVQQALIQATEGDVALAVARRVGGGATARQVAARTEATFDEESFVVRVRASASTAAEAEELASAFGESFVFDGNNEATEEQRSQRDLAERDRDAARRARDDFYQAHGMVLEGPSPDPATVDELAALEGTLAGAEGVLSEIVAAQQTTSLYELISVSPGAVDRSSRLQLLSRPGLRTGLGLLLGLVAAAVVVVLAERSNPRIDEPEAAEAIVGAPVLALVPLLGRRRRRCLERADPSKFRGPFAEAFRTLRSTLDFRAATQDGDGPPRVMVTSATPGEGKSTTAAFLALAYAQADRPPVVIGGDLRRPSIHRAFAVERLPGLSSRALDASPPALSDLLQTDPVTGVSVVPSGPRAEHVGPVVADVIELCERARADGRVAIVDTAPVRVANDAIDYLPAVDSVVVVVRIGRSTVRAVSQMMHMLRINDAHVIGVVVLGSADAADSLRYYYSNYSDEASTMRRSRGGDRPLGPGHDPVPV